jgi:hypothetical protein
VGASLLLTADGLRDFGRRNMAGFVFVVEDAYRLENGQVHFTGQAPRYDRLIKRCVCGVFLADERVGEIEIKELMVTRMLGAKRNRLLKGKEASLIPVIEDAMKNGRSCELRWERDVAE